MKESLDTNLFERPSKNFSMLRKIQLSQLRMLRYLDHICREHQLTYWLDGGTLLGAVRHKGFIPWDDDIDIAMPRKDYLKFIEIAKSSLPKDLLFDLTEVKDYKYSYVVPCTIRDKTTLILETSFNCDAEKDTHLYIDILPIDIYHEGKEVFFFERQIKKIFRRICEIKSSKFFYTSKRDIFYFKTLQKTKILTIDKIAYFYLKFIYLFLKNKKFHILHSKKCGYGYDVYWSRYFNTNDIFPLKEIEFEGLSFKCPNKSDAILKVFYGENYMKIPKIEERRHHFIKVLFDIDKNMDVSE